MRDIALPPTRKNTGCAHSRPRRPSNVAARLAALTALFAAALVVTLPARAQDRWLAPNPLLAADPPAEIPVRLFVGDDLVVRAEEPLSRARTARFLHVFGGGRSDVLPGSTESAIPSGRLTSLRPGGHLIVLDLLAEDIQIEASAFEALLRREGLDNVLAERRLRGETAEPGRDRRQHHLKALVQIGRLRDATFRRELGQSLEIVPVLDPTVFMTGPLPVQVRFRGARLPGARVELLSLLGARIARVTARTGPDGSVSLPVPAEGFHMLRAVHMVRCDRCTGADWQTFRTTYTFANAPVMIEGTVTAPTFPRVPPPEPVPRSPLGAEAIPTPSAPGALSPLPGAAVQPGAAGHRSPAPHALGARTAQTPSEVAASPFVSGWARGAQAAAVAAAAILAAVAGYFLLRR